MTQLYHIFALLKKKHDSEMVFDPSEPKIDEAIFGKQDWIGKVYRYCLE